SCRAVPVPRARRRSPLSLENLAPRSEHALPTFTSRAPSTWSHRSHRGARVQGDATIALRARRCSATGRDGRDRPRARRDRPRRATGRDAPVGVTIEDLGRPRETRGACAACPFELSYPVSVNALRPTVFLFDIDGTLLLTGGAGRRSFEAAFERVCGRRD